MAWQAGQHHPDALAAVVVVHDVLVHSVGQQWHIVSPLDAARRAREGTMPPPPPGCTAVSAGKSNAHLAHLGARRNRSRRDSAPRCKQVPTRPWTRNLLMSKLVVDWIEGSNRGVGNATSADENAAISPGEADAEACGKE